MAKRRKIKVDLSSWTLPKLDEMKEKIGQMVINGVEEVYDAVLEEGFTVLLRTNGRMAIELPLTDGPDGDFDQIWSNYTLQEMAEMTVDALSTIDGGTDAKSREELLDVAKHLHDAAKFIEDKVAQSHDIGEAA